ncbi:MAG TPA: DUF4339 domain-containing protein [Polyangiaceae bacterium]|nr:DUF4339 domain-containing protein [Polyangiaceae bacterium]
MTWAWATEHGAPEWASTEQLISWLARGELPPYTLVWKHGWGEWLPAMQVVELAAAFPRVTAGSRRVARAARSDAPPPVPVAHYPRLRLLAKDVLSESPLPPTASLEPAQAERHVFRDRDQLQKDLVTSQVPAAAMLEAARAMKQLGAPGMGSSAERWSRLQLGTFGEQPPPASEPCSTASRVSNTLSPHAVELPAPQPSAALPRLAPPQPSKRYGRWLALGALVGGALGLLTVSWPNAGDLLARVGVSLAVPHAEDGTPAPVIDTTLHALSPADEAACMAPPEPEPTASSVDRPSEAVPAVLRVDDLPTQRRRAAAAAHSSSSTRGISQH